MFTNICPSCGKTFETARSTAKFCSHACRYAAPWPEPKVRQCRNCGKEFLVTGNGGAGRKHCSRQCAVNYNRKVIKDWRRENPEKVREYAHREHTSGASKRRRDAERQRTLDLYGGKCLVCGVDNPLWLQVDYVHTNIDEPYRHPRHFTYIAAHLDDFRVLCANHHWELTLSGRIEGTDITQYLRWDKTVDMPEQPPQKRILTGENNPGHLLTEAQVLQIRAARESGGSLAGIGSQFGVSKGVVAHIVHRRTWTHI